MIRILVINLVIYLKVFLLMKPTGLICNMRILMQGIPYVVTFTVLHNNVVDAS
jgi:hypothetical protein